MKQEIYEKLYDVGMECILYVGFANYQERENHAKKVFARALNAARKGDIKNVKWVEDTSN